MLRKITGQDAVLAISEDPEASAKIRAFAEGNDRFLICVRLVSEGVDLPRLRLGVLATNISTELFFRQVVGRLVRVIPGLVEQSATLYLPAVEPTITFARRIKEERDHELAQAKNPLSDSIDGTLAGGSSARPSTFVPLESTPIVHDTIFDGASFSPEELGYAEGLRREFEVPLEAPQVAALLRRFAADKGIYVVHRSESVETLEVKNTLGVTAMNEPSKRQEPGPSGGARSISPEISTSNTDGLPIYARKDELRKRTQKAAAKLGGLIGVRPWVLHKQWIEMGGAASEEATVEDLERKLQFFLERISEVNREGRI